METRPASHEPLTCGRQVSSNDDSWPPATKTSAPHVGLATYEQHYTSMYEHSFGLIGHRPYLSTSRPPSRYLSYPSLPGCDRTDWSTCPSSAHSVRLTWMQRDFTLFQSQRPDRASTASKRPTTTSHTTSRNPVSSLPDSPTLSSSSCGCSQPRSYCCPFSHGSVGRCA